MKKVLVVVDMQKDFVDGALGSKEAVAIVPAVVKKIEGFDGQIFATMDTHYDGYMDSHEGKNLPVPHCIEYSAGWKLDKDVQAALDKKGYIQVKKPTFGAVQLADVIRSEVPEVESIELIGLCTDICVVSNALLLRAAFPETDIYVDPECCAGVTPARHKATLEVMRSCQIIA